ncbi:MAG: helix-turn-helix domain-containing protein [Acidimicrobiia bacterium]|jgi:excisionase family DNA binding protein
MQESHDRRSLLTAGQVQSLLGIDRSTVYRMAADGRLPAVRIGRQWRFRPSEIERLVDAGGAGPGEGAVEEPDPVAAQALVDLAAEMLGVMMVVTDMDGVPLTRVANPCPWFVRRTDDPDLLAECIEDWQSRAAGFELETRFVAGAHGFECAHTFVRGGTRLVGMVLAGGVSPDGDDSAGFFVLDEGARRKVLDTLPKVARALSQATTPELAHTGAGAPSTQRGES